MTSDIERIVRDGLHNDLEKLVPDGLSPARNFTLTNSTKNQLQVRERGTSRRLRLPLLAAAAVAVVTVVAVVTLSLLQHGGSVESQAVASSSAKSYVLVGPPISPLFRGRAVTLLASWDQAAPATPAPTRFDNDQLSGESFGDIQNIHVTGKTLTINFLGAPYPKNHDCGYSYTASALVSTKAVAIALPADPGVWPHGQDANCTLTASMQTLSIVLPQTLGNRPILDVGTGSVITDVSGSVVVSQRFKNMTLEVLSVDRNASAETPGSAAGCVSVTYLIRNSGTTTLPIPGSQMTSPELADVEGPIAMGGGSVGGSLIPAQRQAQQAGGSCPLSKPGTPSAPAQSAAVTPPVDAQLGPGAATPPFTLYFQVQGPTSQKLSLDWAGGIISRQTPLTDQQAADALPPLPLP